jgi:predicted transglutaminase-like cysteine proteinase
MSDRPPVVRFFPARLCLATLVALLPMAALTGVVDYQRLLAEAALRYGDAGLCSVQEWRSLVETTRGAVPAVKLQAANDFFNTRLAWRSDREIYGVEDYWATPLEALGRREADCEDFSIAKYITLVALGVPTESLRLVYVTALLASGIHQAHMVLAWYDDPQEPPLILDNVNPQLLRANERSDLIPIFSFNTRDLWVEGSEAASGARPISRLSRWREVLARMNREGLTGTW